MTGLDPALFAVGRAVMTRGAALWLAGRRAGKERSAELTELLDVTVADAFVRRKLERRLDDIADDVAVRLGPTCEREYRDLTSNEKRAALDAVVDTLAAADLSDDAIFAADANPGELARRLRDPARMRSAGLGEAGRGLYDLVLAECCRYLIGMVRQLREFQPRAAALTLERLTSLAAMVAETLDRLPRVTLDAPEGDAQDAEFERRYLAALAENLDRLDLFGLSTRQYRPRLRLTVAYLGLSLSDEDSRRNPRSHRRDLRLRGPGWFTGDEHDGPTTGRSMRVEAALARGTRTFLRGDPGSGKTTLLHWLAVTAARGAFAGELRDWNGCVPFVITLRRYAGQDLPRSEDFLAREKGAEHVAGLMPSKWVHRRLEEGRGLLLVDGVDELTQRQRTEVRDWLGRLLRAYPDIRIVVTSRPTAAAAKWLQREGFDSATLDQMAPSDVVEFIRRWHAAARDGGDLPCEPAELPRYEQALLQHLDANPHVRALAANPLLCALLCALNLDRDTRLPRDRMGIYTHALDLLLERRDAERGIPSYGRLPLDSPQKIELLRSLAWWLSSNNRVEVDTDRAEAEIGIRLRALSLDLDASVVLGHLVERSGVVRAPVVDRVDFVHRTFQEYLAAKEAADRDYTGFLLDHAHLDQWRETIVMAAGHANVKVRAGLLSQLLARAEQEPAQGRGLRLLAAACLDLQGSVDPGLRSRVEAELDRLLPPRSRKESRSLASGGDAILRRLPDTLDGLSEAQAAATVRTAALIHSNRSLGTLAGYATDPRAAVQEELVSAWEYFDADDYAREVLADAPLVDGSLTLRTRRALPSLRHLRRLRSLRLMLYGHDVTDLDWLAGVPFLSYLSASSLGELDLRPLSAHPRLRSLVLAPAQGVRATKALWELPELSNLGIWQDVPWAGIEFLTGIPTLTRLYLGHLETVRDFSPLSALGDLEHLSLSGCALPRAILSSRGRVRRFWLESGAIEGGLRTIVRSMPALADLRLNFCRQVTTLRALVPLPLRELDVDGCPVTNLDPLAEMASLERLSVRRCQKLRDLEPLRDLPKLRTLYLEGARPGLDLSPLAGKRMTVFLAEDQRVTGLDALGSGVRIRRQ